MEPTTTKRGPRGPYRSGQRRRAEILRAALEVFAEHGDRGSSLKEIAERVGLTQAGLLYHFGTREDLLVAVLAERDALDISASRDIAARPGEAVARAAVHNAATPGLVELFVTMSAASIDPEHPAHPFFRNRYATFAKQMAEVLRSDQREGRIRSDIDAEVLARLLMAVADGLQLQGLLEPSVAVASLIEAFNTLCAGMAADSGADSGLSAPE